MSLLVDPTIIKDTPEPSASRASAEVQVRLFSVLKERAGQSTVVVPLEWPATGEQVLDALVQKYPVLGPFRKIMRLAVNQSYVDEQSEVAAGDEVAVITPASGG